MSGLDLPLISKKILIFEDLRKIFDAKFRLYQQDQIKVKHVAEIRRDLGVIKSKIMMDLNI